MLLFTKPIKDITYEDVVSFCELGLRESVNLDYKQDFPEGIKLAKTISAFANTYGGLIIIGVVEEDSKPKPPFEGIEYREKLEERITSIILDNIYPPIFPEIQVSPPKNKRTFIVIRAPESNETPHAIYNNTEAYIRTGNINRPEELVTIEKIEWLKNRRKKSEDLRDYMYRRAEQRYVNICESRKVMAEFGEFALSWCPLYPHEALTTVEKTAEIYRKITSGNLGIVFPKIMSGGVITRIQDGIYYFALDETTKEYEYCEINKFGLLFYKQNAGLYSSETQIKKIDAKRIIGILWFALQSAHTFCEQMGYWGLIEVKLSLNRLLGVRLVPITRESFDGLVLELPGEEEITENVADDSLPWQFNVSASHLADEEFRKRKVIELGKDINWSFGFEVREEIVEALVRKWERS